MKFLILLFTCCSSCASLCAQSPAVPDSSIQAKPDSSTKVSFSTPLPALNQIPGAPAPFYTYLWDFGDGHFSTAANPEHTYSKPGMYDVAMYAVNNYDDGKKPPRKKKLVQTGTSPYIAQASAAEQDFFKANGIFELRYNCMAKPNDTMVLIAGWKNNDVAATNGTLFLLLNEKQFEQRSFDTTGFRFYNNEKFDSLPPMLALADQQQLQVTESGSPPSHNAATLNGQQAAALLQQTVTAYRNTYAINLNNIPAGATRFSFAELRVTPEMIRDTNATLAITGIFVPEKGNAVMHRLNIPIVTSHDPNKMNLKNGPLSYRFISKNKELTYKVRFQNNGKGPARRIALDMTLPEAMDPQTISVKDMHPYCKPCDSMTEKKGCWELIKNEKGAVFTFHGIYLAGSAQAGVEDFDSTKGFMQFTVHTKKRLENKPFKSRTAIYFDKNEPVITNYATGRFIKSLSPIIMAGYEKATGSGPVSNGLVTGIGIAPLAPYKPYLQFELYYKAGLRTESTHFRDATQSGIIHIDTLKQPENKYTGFDSVQTNAISQLKLVPLQLRYNINDYISIGGGAVLTADMGGYTETTNSYRIQDANGVAGFIYTKKNKEQVKAFSNILLRPFADLQVGKVRWGPHLGIRYYYNGNKNSFVYFYAGWRL